MSHWLQVSSGRGPAECCWVVKQLTDRIVADAKARGIAIRLIDCEAGDEHDTLKSALLSFEGEDNAISIFVTEWEGSILWKGLSPYRPTHKRKNWFVAVSHVATPKATTFSESDVRFETMRSSGPGGQHTNKTSSAVRAWHDPTEICAVAQEERSRERWTQHDALERGNPLRTFRGADFRES